MPFLHLPTPSKIPRDASLLERFIIAFAICSRAPALARAGHSNAGLEQCYAICYLPLSPRTIYIFISVSPLTTPPASPAAYNFSFSFALFATIRASLLAIEYLGPFSRTISVRRCHGQANSAFRQSLHMRGSYLPDFLADKKQPAFSSGAIQCRLDA